MEDFSDLVGKPYGAGGRGPDFYDCYGLVIEAARRSGKPLRDVVYSDHALELSDKYAPTLNVEKISGPEKRAVIEMEYKGEIHIGFCLDEKTFIHTTSIQGVRISRIGVIPIRNFYRIK